MAVMSVVEIDFYLYHLTLPTLHTVITRGVFNVDSVQARLTVTDWIGVSVGLGFISLSSS
jgi:hypothetical protein